MPRPPAALLAAVALIAGTAACTSDDPAPEPPPAAMTAQLTRSGETTTYDLVDCFPDSEQSLVALGTGPSGELLTINIAEGSGSVAVLDLSEEPLMAGTVGDYSAGTDLLFTIEGTYERDGEQSPFEVWGNCSAKPQ